MAKTWQLAAIAPLGASTTALLRSSSDGELLVVTAQLTTEAVDLLSLQLLMVRPEETAR